MLPRRRALLGCDTRQESRYLRPSASIPTKQEDTEQVMAESARADAPRHRILVVDDDPEIREMHARMLKRFGHEVETAADGIEALALLPLEFDLVVSDAEMPNMDGFDVAKRIREHLEYAHVPIVMVTGLANRADRLRAYDVGINDFINKPVDPDELKLRTQWLLELKTSRDALERHQQELEATVEKKTGALREALRQSTDAKRETYAAHLDRIFRLSVAAEYRDKDTADHITRIGLFSEIVARAIGMAPSEIEVIRHAAPMHDVGKLGIPGLRAVEAWEARRR